MNFCSPLGLSPLSPSLSGPCFSGGTSPGLLALNAVSMLRPAKALLWPWAVPGIPDLSSTCLLGVPSGMPTDRLQPTCSSHELLACPPSLFFWSFFHQWVLPMAQETELERSAVNSSLLFRLSGPHVPAALSPLKPPPCQIPALTGLSASGPAPPVPSLSTAEASRQQGQERSQRVLLTSQILFLILPLSETPHWPAQSTQPLPEGPCYDSRGSCDPSHSPASSSAQAMLTRALHAGCTTTLLPHACAYSVPRRGSSLTSVRSSLTRHLLMPPPPAIRTSISTPS